MKPTRRTTILPAALVARVLLCALVISWPDGGWSAPPDGFMLTFDDGAPTWRAEFEASRVRVLAHQRQSAIFARGGGAESLVLEASRRGGAVQLEHDLPPARVIEDLRVSLRMRSNRGGAELRVRVVFPNEKDPATGAVLSTYLAGDVYSRVGNWQQLECTTTDRQMRDRVRLLRARLNRPEINARGAFVDRVVLVSLLEPGTTDVFLDELSLSPIVSPEADRSVIQASQETPEPSPSADSAAGAGTESGTFPDDAPADSNAAPDGPPPSRDAPAELRLDRLTVEGRPFFPRVVAYHGERLGELAEARLNVVWVPDFENEQLLESLRLHGLWATATPPRAVGDDGRVLDPRDASILPFSSKTRPILFWNLGTRVPEEARDDLIAWTEQVRDADRAFLRPRPVMVDVSGGQERAASRHVPMVWASRHVLHTSFSPRDYRDWLVERQRHARPGSFLGTWIQIEPAAANDWRSATRHRPFVEPEQIRLQVYTALSAGCRAIGFWKTRPLDGDDPLAREQRLAVAQLCLELEVLEPWLATATVEEHVPFKIKNSAQPITQRNLAFGTSPAARQQTEALLREEEDQRKRSALLNRELQAAVLSTDFGKLILPVWYGHDAQCVPGQMSAYDATMLVHAEQSASFWVVTPTEVTSLSTREREPGGVRITLPNFDQTAVILVTSDRAQVDELRRRIARLAEPSARVSVELARAKLARVQGIDEELRDLGVGQADAPQLIRSARMHLTQAENRLAQGNHDAARQQAAAAMQALRTLQRASWNDAVRRLSSPLSSPHAICFQTLPEHWRLLARLGRSPLTGTENRLRSGNFDDVDTVMAEGWKHAQNPVPGVRADTDLYPGGREGKYVLRLRAAPESREEVPTLLPRAPVTVRSPAVTVRSGDIVHVSGWLRLTAPVLGSLDGVMIYDNLTGPAGALRWRERGEWGQFEMLREVRESGDFELTISLTGLGEVQLDDLRIVPHPPPAAGETAEAPAPAERPGRSSPLNLLDRLQGVRPGSRQ